uniref:5-formyltetrahydrofolate cyclo-ligase family protein n=1 Tax=Mimivirus LCMiAC02 TaxID=2506609 RepID=A0A4P6VQ75_9VIRU|nr:MAG: 5-formyltetrahydrofolate cyclo-ligase family protein [Mimivirus LCMiAC02]
MDNLKKNIRISIVKKRKLYTCDDISKNSNLIKNNLFSYFNFNNISLLHIFLPISEKNEIDTFLIIKEIYSNYKNIKIVVPIVDFNNKVLLHKYYHNDILLHKNKYGILEPKKSETFTNLDSIDIILIPLLAFDKKGNRVGYGGGYYDKFLINCKGVIRQSLKSMSMAIGKKIGLSFEEPINLISDINKFDIKLDYCITPKNVYNFN